MKIKVKYMVGLASDMQDRRAPSFINDNLTKCYSYLFILNFLIVSQPPEVL